MSDWRTEHLAELHRRGGLVDRDHALLVEHLRRRRARLKVHELVALEEDARPNLELRVLMNREAVVLDLHRNHRPVLALAERGDLLDDADLDAGDADRGLGLEVVHGVEGGLELVSVGERVRLGVGEVGRDDDDHERDQARLEGVMPPLRPLVLLRKIAIA